MGKGLKVIFWNVRSLFNKLDSICDEILKEQPDILNISETWLNLNLETFMGVVQRTGAGSKPHKPLCCF